MATPLGKLVEKTDGAGPILTMVTIGHQEAADLLADLGIATSETSVRRWRNANGVKLSPTAKTVTGPAEPVLDDEGFPVQTPEDRIALLMADNQRLYKQAAKHKAKGEEMVQAVYRGARDAAMLVGLPDPVVPPKSDTRTRGEEVAIWHLTDWQGGKKTVSYGLDVMDARVEEYVRKAKLITEVMRADHPVRKAVIILSGDMVEGVSIFPGQVWELDGMLFEQMFRVSARIEWMIREALTIYEEVEVICEWGNHGRLGKKSDGISPSDNVDRMVYEVVRGRLGDEPRVTNYQVSGDWYQHFTVGNYSAIVIHGDEIKGFGGQIPAYGILKKVNAWGSGVVDPFVDCYLGHYHQRMQLTLANGGSVYMTGSTESDSNYAKEFVAATGQPSQRINFVDPEKGRVTYEASIWLT
jgi:hypothetical protein